MSDAAPPPRWVPQRELPARAFVPGRGKKPARDEVAANLRLVALDAGRWRENETWLFGVDLYNHGYFWEAHEAWEELWRITARTSDESKLLQGLIQCAAGALKARAGEAGEESAGLASLVARGTAKLETLSSRHRERYMGLELARFVRAMRAFASRASDKPPLIELASEDTFHFEIDADIRTAETPPGRFYTDAALHERAIERVFGRSWQLVSEEAPVENGSIAPVTLLAGSLDEPLVLTRDANGELRCLSNVCTHRANIVASERCRATSLVCGYHGRRFELDGKFRSMPEFEAAQDFPRASDDLKSLPLARFGPLAFTTLESSPPSSFEAQFGDLMERLAWLPHDRLVLDASRSHDYEFDANWMLYVDNYLEGFHIPFVHASLNAAIEWSAYSTELFGRSSLQIGHAKPNEIAFEPPRASVDHGTRIAGYYAWLWPNLMLNFYPWGLSLNLVEPQGVSRTRVRFRAYVWDESKLERGAGSGLDSVEMEDESVVQAVQRGIRSRLYTRGRYSPTREQGVHHFHRLLTAELRS